MQTLERGSRWHEGVSAAHWMVLAVASAGWIFDVYEGQLLYAGYAIYFPELFPTRLRATGSSACFNLGRVLGAAILIVRGTLGSALGLRWAVVALSGLFWVGLVILVFAPETRGRELPE